MQYTKVNKLKLKSKEAAQRIIKSKGGKPITEDELASYLYAFSEELRDKDDEGLKWHDLVDTSY